MAGVVARHALNHVEHDVVFARQREIALRDVAKMHAAVGLLDAAAQTDIDAHHAGDVIAARHHDMLEAGAGCVRPQECVEIRVRRQQRDILLHDFARTPHQEHVGVQRLRHEVAAADQLDGVDVLVPKAAAARRSRCATATMLGITRS